MWKRSFLAVAVLHLGPATHHAAAAATEVYAQLFPLTGEVLLVNKSTVPIPFVYYSITSASNALDGSSEAWQSISDNYDVSGNGLIDSANEWFKLAEEPGQLTEGAFSGPGGALPPTRAISLGTIWDPDKVPFPDLTFELWDDEQAIPVTVELALDGDFSGNQVVDLADYVLWRRYQQSSTMLLADGNQDGAVNQIDLLLWRARFGMTLPLPPYLPGSGSQATPSAAQLGAAPEPASIVVAVVALIGWFATAPRRARPGGSP